MAPTVTAKRGDVSNARRDAAWRSSFEMARLEASALSYHGGKTPMVIAKEGIRMAVRIEKAGSVWTVIHDRPEARNAMDPESADALTAAFLEFDANKDASAAVFYGAGGAFCAGWDLKYVSTLDADYPLGELDIPIAGPCGNGGEIPRGPLGPSRLQLDKPLIPAVEGPPGARGMELGSWGAFPGLG